MKRIFFLIATVLVLSSCKENSSAQKVDTSGFKRLCKFAESFEWSNEQDKTSLLNDFSKFINKKIPNTEASRAVEALASFAETKQGDRYEMLTTGAKESGVPDFDCQILKDNY